MLDNPFLLSVYLAVAAVVGRLRGLRPFPIVRGGFEVFLRVLLPEEGGVEIRPPWRDSGARSYYLMITVWAISCFVFAPCGASFVIARYPPRCQWEGDRNSEIIFVF